MLVVFLPSICTPACPVAFCMASTHTSMSFIGLSLPSMWLCPDSQSAIKISGPGLYIIQTLYWWIFSSMHCICCNNVAISFLNIDTSSLWSVMMSTSLPKHVMMEFSKPCSIPSASHLMLLYLTLHLSNFCYQMLLGKELCFLVSCFLASSVVAKLYSAALRLIPDTSVCK